jgi:pyruvate dehydrogenase E2 component (dihydrolipoamide acetyltransferase)
MSLSFKLPDLGEGIHEAEILTIPVTVGQEVKEGDAILEVETDKAAVEIPSPYTATVSEISVNPGDIVNVGDVMMTFAVDSNLVSSQVVEVDIPEQQPLPVMTQSASTPSPKGTETGPVPASPSTRRLARELGVDLKQIDSTGPAGLVTADDVRRFSKSGGAIQAGIPERVRDPVSTEPSASIDLPALPDFTKWGDVERIPFRSIRRATAKQMALSWSQIPHVNSQDVVDMTKLEAFRQKHKVEVASLGGKLTVTVFILKAIATALKACPQVNATLDAQQSEIILKKYIHIGVAMNTDRGLIVPVVRNVDRKSIKELAIEVNELVHRTRERKTTLEEMQGGTFTVTNAGAMGGGFFAPIINYPEVAILGLGEARMQPVVRENEDGGYIIVPRLVMPIVLCIDHRVLDGADAIRFLKVIINSLEDPDQLLMNMV